MDLHPSKGGSVRVDIPLDDPPENPIRNGRPTKECLDYFIPLGERHLWAIVKEYSVYYNRGRPHSTLGPGIPEPNLARSFLTAGAKRVVASLWSVDDRSTATLMEYFYTHLALLEQMSTEGEFHEHRDVTVLLSLPGVGRVITATMLAEASQALAERDYHALRCYAGSAPITHQSGKRRCIVMRRSCNPRLRNALYHWSRCSMQSDARSKEHYGELRAKGHSHGRALRGVADRLIAVLISMLASGTVYDPTRRVAQPTA